MERFPFFYIGRLNIVKISIFPQVELQILSNPYQISNFFEYKLKTNPKIHMEIQGTQNNQNWKGKEEQS